MLSELPDDFHSVQVHEIKAIAIRRKEVSESGGRRESDSTSDGRPALAGLAMSGGGIRAACIGLGVLQSFYRRGILRQIDYLSTVSGSGYVASWLSSWLAAEQNRGINWHPDQEERKGVIEREMLPFHCGEGEAQPVEVQKLANRGETLNRPLRFLSRHLGGLIAINAFLLSGLVAVGALLAYLFRLLDLSGVQVFLFQLGFSTDISRAFFPAFVMLLLWIVSSLFMRYLQWKKVNSPQFSAIAYFGLLTTLALGVVSVLGLGNADAYAFLRSFGISSNASSAIQTALTYISRGLLLLFTLAIVPSLNIKAIIRSGTSPKNPRETWVFNFVARTLVAGVPLFVFWIMCREDFSQWHHKQELPYSMCRGHIRDWELFWNRVQGTKSALNRSPNPTHLNKLSDKLWKQFAIDDELDRNAFRTIRQHGEIVKNTPMNAISEFLKLNNVRDERIRETWIWDRWLSFAGHLLRFGERFESQWRDELRFRTLKNEIIADINQHILSNPDLVADPNGWRKDLASAEGPSGGEPSQMASGVGGASNSHKDLLEMTLRRLKVARDDLLLNQDDKPTETPWVHYHQLESNFQRRLSERTYVSTKDIEQFDADTGDAEQALLDYRRKLGNLQQANWNLLLIAYSNNTEVNLIVLQDGAISPTDALYNWNEVFSMVVLDHDQQSRLQIGTYAILNFILIGLVFSVNPTLLHGFYRDQLAELWIVPHPKFGRWLPLNAMKNCEKGAPLHLLHGAMNLFGPKRNLEKDTSGRFTFSRLHVGAERTGYASTDFYMGGKYSLADAMAISGAAVSPSAVDNILVRWLLILFNFRLGQWLNHPAKPPGDLSLATPLRLAVEQLTKPPEDRAYQFVSDGGHDENTGIGALLQRRCRVIIACDVGQDGAYKFADVRKLISEAGDKFGIRFTPVDTNYGTETALATALSPLVPVKSGPDKEARPLSSKHFVVFRIDYPDNTLTEKARLDLISPLTGQLIPKMPPEKNCVNSGWLILIKSTLTCNDPEVLQRFPDQNQEFPHDATLDQFFEPNRFMRYRQLGECMGEAVWNECFGDYWARKEAETQFWLAEVWPHKPGPTVPEASDEPHQQKVDSEVPWSGTPSENREQILEILNRGTNEQVEAVCNYIVEHFEEIRKSYGTDVVTNLHSAFERCSDDSARLAICNALSLLIDSGSREAINFIRLKCDDKKISHELHMHLLALLRDLSIEEKKPQTVKRK